MTRIHHATAKKAAKLGFTITVAETGSHFNVTFGKLSLVALDAKQGVEDMTVLKMLAAEYPKLKAVQDGGDWELYLGKGKNAELVGSGSTLQDAWDEYTESNESEGGDEGEASEDGPGDESEDGESKSVVKRKYKKAYRPFRQTCGDDLSRLITAHLTVIDAETGDKKIDEKKLVRFAKLNDAWVDSYASLNVGMRRMNVANRIRAKVRRDGHEIVWN